jgi:hypothetical protein
MIDYLISLCTTQEGLFSLVVGSDLLIALAYFSIPVSMLWVFRNRSEDLPYPALWIAFVLFIFACGATHLAHFAAVVNGTSLLGMARTHSCRHGRGSRLPRPSQGRGRPLPQNPPLRSGGGGPPKAVEGAHCSMHHIETAQPSWRIASPSAKQSDPAFAGFALASSVPQPRRGLRRARAVDEGPGRRRMRGQRGASARRCGNAGIGPRHDRVQRRHAGARPVEHGDRDRLGDLAPALPAMEIASDCRRP